MKSIFTVTDETTIHALLDRVEYGTLALVHEDQPYSLPINFVRIGNSLYFHGSKKGRKIDTMQANPRASFSVVEAGSVIPSHFSSADELACTATQFFASVMVEGMIAFVDDYDEKVTALAALMEKLPPEGHYKSLSDTAYQKAIHTTTLWRLDPESASAKYKFGQHLTPERFERIVEHLKTRNTTADRHTLKHMHTNGNVTSVASSSD